MSVSHFWYKLTTKAGNLFLNLKEKAEKKNAYIWNNPWIFFFFFEVFIITNDQKRILKFQHQRS